VTPREQEKERARDERLDEAEQKSAEARKKAQEALEQIE
jgi:hypothetical protein